MPQLNVLELAEAGNVKALAALMNPLSQPRALPLSKLLWDSCFEILLESAQVPNQQTLAAFVRQRITRLRAGPIKQMKLYVRQTGEELLGVRNLNLQDNLACGVTPKSSATCPIRECKKAIAALMNRSFQPKGITVVKATFKMVAFKFLLESAQVPNQQD